MKKLRFSAVVLLSLILTLFATSCSLSSVVQGELSGSNSSWQSMSAPSSDQQPEQPPVTNPDEPTIILPNDTFTGDGNFTVGSEYFDGENILNVNNEIHFFYIEEDGSFILDSVSIGGMGVISCSTVNGTAVYDETIGVYTLTPNQGNVLHGKFDGETFLICNADGSNIATVNNRGGDGVTEVELSVGDGNTDYGYRDLANNYNGKAMQDLYRQLYKIYDDFSGSDRDIPLTEQGYVLATVPLADLGLTDSEIVSVWKIFGLSNPAFYYFNNTVSFASGEMILIVDEAYATAAERNRLEADIEAMRIECGIALEGKESDLDRVMAIHDYIVKTIDYAYEEDGVTPSGEAWAHNIIGVSSVKSGVCEAYAKTFQYLCLNYGIEALTLSGYGGEPHAWNIAKVSGEWYGFDATWNDTGDNNALSYDCFGLSFSNMTASHSHDNPTQYGLSYLYDLPLISNTDIQLVTLYKNGEDLGFCLNIDDAFSQMTDKDAEYTVKLFDYSYTGPKLLSVPAMKHYIFSESTPNVKKISLKGSYKLSGEGYVSVTPIYLAGYESLTLTSDFSIENMEFMDLDFKMFRGIFIENATLFFEGALCESEVAYIGERDGGDDSVSSRIYHNANVTIYSELAIDMLVSPNDNGLQLRKNSTIGVVETSGISVDYFSDHTISINIGEFRGIGAHPSISLKGADLIIGDIYVDETADRFAFNIHLGTMEELSHISMTGKVNADVEVFISGSMQYFETDLEGNIIDSWTEEVEPSHITESFLKINENIDLDSIAIMYVEQTDNGGYNIDKAPLYSVDDKGNIVRGEIVTTEDGFVLKDDILVDYIGTETHITVPSSVKHIGAGAFFNCKTVESVVFPEGVITVGKMPFQFCMALKSISLPSTLEYMDISVLSIETGNDVAVTYGGTVLDWVRLISKSPESDHWISVKHVECTDGKGNVSRYEPLEGYVRYICDRTYYGTYEGEEAYIICFFDVSDEKVGIFEYTFFGGYYVGSMLGDDFLPYTYNNGIYTVNIGEITVYVRLTEEGFVFCDENGEELTSAPQF